MKKIILYLALFFASLVNAQVKIGDNPTNVGESSILELESTNKGFVLPRVANTSAVTTPVNGMMVYDVSTHCTKVYENDVWSDCLSLVSASTEAVVSNYDCSGTLSGSLILGQQVSGVTKTITATVGIPGTYYISASANGVTFIGAGTWSQPGTFDVTLYASGTPTSAGTAEFTLNTTPSCSFNAEITSQISSGGSAVVSSYSLSQNNGYIFSGEEASLTWILNATVSTAGTYDITAVADGITYTGSGTFSGTGAQTVTLTGTGTTTAVVSSTFTTNTTPSYSITKFVYYKDRAYGDGEHDFAYRAVQSSTGKVWLEQNLGSKRSKVGDALFATFPTGSDDYEAYGSLYQWGRYSDGHELINWTSSTVGAHVYGATTTLSSTDTPGNNLFILPSIEPNDWRSPQNDNLWQGVNGINNPCPVGFRIPTQDEFNAEYTANNITNLQTGFDSMFKFVAHGYIGEGLGIGNQTNSNPTWTSTVSGTYSRYSELFSSAVNSTPSTALPRYAGFGVRCVKD